MFDMYALEAVTIIVTVGAVLVALTPPFRFGRAFGEFGRQGGMWFERGEDRPVEERPSEDAIDPPLPRRPLRARF